MMLAPEMAGGQPPARDTSAQAVPRPSEVAPGEIREIEPKVHYLPDESGSLVWVPEFSFERWQELLRLEIQVKSQIPQYKFVDLVTIRGRSVGQRAELEAVVPFRLEELQGGRVNEWVRVPLRLNQAVVSPPIQHEGEGEFSWELSKDGDGYVAWIRAAEGSTHRVTLKMKVPLVRGGGETRLALVTPRAPTQLQLSVEGPRVEARVGNSEQSVLTAQPDGDQRTLLTVEGAAGALDLSWRPKDETPPVLEASGSILVSVAGNRIECHAGLKVRSFGAAVDSFVVRLPPGMELIPAYQPGLRTSLVAEPPGGTPAAGQRVLVQRLGGSANGPLEVQLVAWRPPEPENSKQWIETAGFEVLGAVRQSGIVEFQVEEEWRADWLADQNVRRVESAADPARPRPVTARFEYYRQPYSLRLELQPAQAQLSVEPTYLYLVNSDSVRLEATLRYKVSGAWPKEVAIDLSGWTVDRVSPEGLVASPLSLASAAPLRIPLASGGSTGTGEFELKVEAQRKLSEDQQRLALSVPRLQGAKQEPAAVAIAPADNVELVPQEEDIKGLLPESVPAILQPADLQQPVLAYREEPSANGAVFVGSLWQRKCSAEVEVDSRVRIEEGRVAVEQRLAYQISYVPLQELALEFPRFLVERGDLQVTLDSNSLLTRILPGDSPPEAAERLQVAVALPGPRLGRCVILVRYLLPRDALAGDTERELQVPLGQPREDSSTTVTRNVLRLSSAGGIAAEVQGEEWTREESPPSAESPAGDLLWMREGACAQVPIALNRVPDRPRGKTVVRKAWIQSWLGKRDRRERVSFRLAGLENRLQIQLPSGALTEGVEVWLDGEPYQRFALSADRRLTVDLGDSPPLGEITVELFYWFRVLDPAVARMTLEPPTVLGTRQVNRCYWQLVLPDNEYLLWSPGNLNREMVWRWRDFGWGRQENLSQRELEESLGASRQDPLPQTAHGYLFSSVGSPLPCRIVTAKRHVILLALSGCTLAVGLLLIRFSALRHPAMVFSAGVVLLAAGMIYPDPAILAAQAGACGLVLLLLARLLEWAMVRRRQPLAVARAAAYPGPESKTGESLRRPGESSARAGATPAIPVTATEPPP